MAYNQIDELPPEIKEQLPGHALQIFVAAFNSCKLSF
jgi:cation transport regulator